MLCEMHEGKLYVMPEYLEEQLELNSLHKVQIGIATFVPMAMMATITPEGSAALGQAPKTVQGNTLVESEVSPEYSKDPDDLEASVDTPEEPAPDPLVPEVPPKTELPNFDTITDKAVFEGIVRNLARSELLDICEAYDIPDTKGKRATTLVQKLLAWFGAKNAPPVEPEVTPGAPVDPEPPVITPVADEALTDEPEATTRATALQAAKEHIAVYKEASFKKVLDSFGAAMFSEIDPSNYTDLLVALKERGEEERKANEGSLV